MAAKITEDMTATLGAFVSDESKAFLAEVETIVGAAATSRAANSATLSMRLAAQVMVVLVEQSKIERAKGTTNAELLISTARAMAWVLATLATKSVKPGPKQAEDTIFLTEVLLHEFHKCASFCVKTANDHRKQTECQNSLKQ